MFDQPVVKPVAVTVKQAAVMTSLGVRTIVKRLQTGDLARIKVGRRTSVSVESIERLLRPTPPDPHQIHAAVADGRGGRRMRPSANFTLGKNMTSKTSTHLRDIKELYDRARRLEADAHEAWIELVDRIEAGHKAGVTYVKIAKEIGKSPTWITVLRHRACPVHGGYHSRPNSQANKLVRWVTSFRKTSRKSTPNVPPPISR